MPPGTRSFAQFVECFGRGRSDKGIEEVISQAGSSPRAIPGPWSGWMPAQGAGGEDLEHLENTPWIARPVSGCGLLAEGIKGSSLRRPF